MKITIEANIETIKQVLFLVIATAVIGLGIYDLGLLISTMLTAFIFLPFLVIAYFWWKL